jgi:hypothetical protein
MMHNNKAIFKRKLDDSEVAINKDSVVDVTPDADMRFSLIALTNGEKHFVVGTENEVWEKLRKAADFNHDIDSNIII